jgi:hypothetical protein
MILLVCSIILLIGALTEGVERLLGKIGDYMVKLYNVLIDLAEFKKKEKKTNIDVPL